MRITYLHWTLQGMMCIFGITFPFTVSSQCTNQVTALTGSEVVGGVTVTVTSEGVVGSLNYCTSSTGPYIIGNDGLNPNCEDGSYTFSFSPPISSLSFNISGVTDSLSTAEEVILFINGVHYPVPTVGVLNGCEPLATLTPSGNIRACINCGVSGWSETTISGNISSIMIKDSVLMSYPGGAVFSLFICDSVATGVSMMSKSELKIYPIPSSTELVLENLNMINPSIKLVNSLGQPMVLDFEFETNKLILNTSSYPAGAYFLTWLYEGVIQSRVVIIE